MSEHNRVILHGTASVRKSWPANGEKQALVVGSVKPTGSKAFISVKAFGETAEQFGNAHELLVTVEGHLEGEKPKEPTKGSWPLVVVLESVTVHAPRGVDPEPF